MDCEHDQVQFFMICVEDHGFGEAAVSAVCPDCGGYMLAKGKYLRPRTALKERMSE